jgi:hypothetical protein
MEAYKVDDRRFKRDMKKAEQWLKKQFPKRVYEKFKSVTPKGDAKKGYTPGNAKRNTKLKRTDVGHEIIGNYPYSGVLDYGGYPNPPKGGEGKTSGGFSKKAPKGMSEPTVKYAEKIVDDFLRRL